MTLAHHEYHIKWSDEDGEYAATCPSYPALRWLDEEPYWALRELLDCIRHLEAAKADEDPRKAGLKHGLRQLTSKQLDRVINYPREMVLDTFNYHEGKFCPLAVGLGLDETLRDPTNERVTEALTLLGYSIYNTRGIAGEFYQHPRRLEDLRIAAREVKQEKTRCDLKCVTCGIQCIATAGHGNNCQFEHHVTCR